MKYDPREVTKILVMYLFTHSAHFFKHFSNAFDLTPSPLRFEHLLGFCDGLGGTLRCSRIGQNKAYRYEETMSNIPLNLNNSTPKDFCVCQF